MADEKNATPGESDDAARERAWDGGERNRPGDRQRIRANVRTEIASSASQARDRYLDISIDGH